MSYFTEESYDVYSEQTRRARTPKSCSACGRVIAVGQLYTRVAWVYDKSCSSCIRCGACQTTHLHLRSLDPGYWPDERLACGASYESEWECEPPEEVKRLPFISDIEASALLEAAYAERLKVLERRRAVRRIHATIP